MKTHVAKLAKAPNGRSLIVLIVSSTALTTAPLLSAHHSISRHYHRDQSVTVEGVVAEVVFQNPHAKIHLDVPDASGGVTAWILEWDDVSDLRRQDVAADTIRDGDEIIVSGYPARAGTLELYIKRIDRPADGLVYLDD